MSDIAVQCRSAPSANARDLVGAGNETGSPAPRPQCPAVTASRARLLSRAWNAPSSSTSCTMVFLLSTAAIRSQGWPSRFLSVSPPNYVTALFIPMLLVMTFGPTQKVACLPHEEGVNTWANSEECTGWCSITISLEIIFLSDTRLRARL